MSKRKPMTDEEVKAADKGVTAAGWLDPSGNATGARIRADWLRARENEKKLQASIDTAPTVYVISFVMDGKTKYFADYNKEPSEATEFLHQARVFGSEAQAHRWIDLVFSANPDKISCEVIPMAMVARS